MDRRERELILHEAMRTVPALPAPRLSAGLSLDLRPMPAIGEGWRLHGLAWRGRGLLPLRIYATLPEGFGALSLFDFFLALGPGQALMALRSALRQAPSDEDLRTNAISRRLAA